MSSEVKRIIFLNHLGPLEWTILALIFLIIVYGILRTTHRLRSYKRAAILSSLKLSAFLILVLILLNPAIRTEKYIEEKRHLPLLIDWSWSMNLPQNTDPVSRIDALRSFFKKQEGFFKKLEKYLVIDYFAFHKDLIPVSKDFIFTENPRGDGTDIGEALKRVKEKYEAQDISSIILLSDGANNEGSLGDIEAFTRDIGFLINTVSPVPEDAPDIWIENVKVSEVGFVRYPLRVEVAIKSLGFQAPTLPITLREGEGSEGMVSIKEANLDNSDPKGFVGKVEFSIRPTSPGRKIYTVSVPVISEERVVYNNSQSFSTDVVRDAVRVLHVAGAPSWDVRFLRDTLKRNPNVDLVSFFILREASDLVFAPQSELSLIPFPVEELFLGELDTFDVVIFQNFDFRPYGIFSPHLDSLRDYVTGSEGAFLMIGGEDSFDGGLYEGTPISEILPVELNLMIPHKEETYSTDGFQMKLTNLGKRHPVTRLTSDPVENIDVWKAMPVLDGYNRVKGIKSESLLLATSPDGDPILALMEVGTGRTASLLADSSWRWGFIRAGEGDVSPYYGRFWDRLLLWLVKDPELKNIRVKTDRATYALGEKGKIRALALGPEDEDFDIISYVTLPDGRRQDLTYEKTSAEVFETEIELREKGTYRVEVKSRKGIEGTEEGDEIAFLVEPPRGEIKGPTENKELLRALAEKTGGRYISVNDDPDELKIDTSPKKKLSGYRTTPIWDKPWWFLLLVGLLFSEWMLGRRWGLK